MSLSWVGPACLAGAVAYVYNVNQVASAGTDASGARSKALVSTTSFVAMLFIVYAMGAIPRNNFFPAWWFKGNVFNALYRYGYCSEAVGYNLLKRLMHQPQPHPHSDFRGGIRALAEVRRVGDASAPASSTVVAKLGENLETWRPPCLDESGAATGSPASADGPGRRTAAAAAAAALDKLKRTNCADAAATLAAQSVPDMFRLRGGLPVDVQKLKYRKSDRNVIVFPIPIFGDNYSYVIFSFRTKKCCLVDPADPIAALKCILYLKKHIYGDNRDETEIKLTDVLTTHKHWDHAGGNKDLMEYAKSEENTEKAATDDNVCALDLNIYGPADESTHFVNKTVREGDTFTVCDGAVHISVLAAPGHTTGSLLFVASDARAETAAEIDRDSFVIKNRLAVFTGDALFSGGIGAPFETKSMAQIKKTRADFVDSDAMRVHPVTGEAVAPEDVLLYVGHEYTERLVEEMSGIFARLVSGPGAQQQQQQGREVPASAIAYRDNLGAALRDVKIMRAQTDGLEDARQQGEDLVSADSATLSEEDRDRQRQLRNRIPLCTVPTTLALEKKINPLLTVRPETLDAVQLECGALDTNLMEKSVYLSLDRVLD